MQELLSFATGLTPLLQVGLIVILVIIFKDQIAEKLFGDREDGVKRSTLTSLHNEMSELSQHFNHETTDQNSDIKNAILALGVKQDRAVQILSEIKEYGIKCRKE